MRAMATAARAGRADFVTRACKADSMGFFLSSRRSASGSEASADVAELGPRAARTRDKIIAASRELFLKHGYAGTRIAQITAECSISRAGFYTYFRDKQEIFNALGVAAYRAVLNTIAEWDDLPRPASREDLTNWVTGYFARMDEHGQAGPFEGVYEHGSQDSFDERRYRCGHDLCSGLAEGDLRG